MSGFNSKESDNKQKLGFQITPKGVLADSATGLKAEDIRKYNSDSGTDSHYDFFYVMIPSSTGTTGTMTIKNVVGDQLDDFPFDVYDDWYVFPVKEIVVDAGNTALNVYYGVSA